ncbi:MAG: YabP/YqfC family sporulation protein [Clostridia bacterium]|nr:YabP/YqfC family sporulation protein [Clostridia bacterium]
MAIEQRKSISVTGVESVKAFSETRIELALSGSTTRMIVLGTGLKITGFSKANGTFTAVGNVEGVRYGGGLKSRLFK